MKIFRFSVGSEAKRVAVRCVFAIGVVCWVNFSIMSCELGNFLRSRSRSHNHVKFAGYLQWTLCFFDKKLEPGLAGFFLRFLERM